MSSERNPFNFGDLALDAGFADRERELAELTADIRNGQNVVVFAPRRYGKSSLVWRVAQTLVAADEALVAQVDLMLTTTKEQLAGALAKAIHDEIATPLLRAREKAARIFSGLRVAPVMTVDSATGELGFSFRAGHERADVDATLQGLLELPARLAAERRRRVALVFDEFQEVLAIDPHLPSLMRSIFQTQPDVAHVYLGSKRAMMERLFNDANEPFWRSAKQMELDVIEPAAFAPFLRERFESANRRVPDAVLGRLLATTGGHPYATQELAYALWEETPRGRTANEDAFARALDRVLRGENAHFSLVWDRASQVQRLVLQALAAEPTTSITSSEYRQRHGLPATSSIARAVEALVEDELLRQDGPGAYAFAEPFLGEWLARRLG
ncbi:MAG TPA: ATP-binding protein [Gaiellaceae bacterium]|nr:ATP-binding protein [Gaiellaceae bacterium]